MKKIRVYTENHAPERFWLNHLVHPVRAFWGDGTDDWPKWEKDFLFYKDYFEQVLKANYSNTRFDYNSLIIGSISDGISLFSIISSSYSTNIFREICVICQICRFDLLELASFITLYLNLPIRE